MRMNLLPWVKNHTEKLNKKYKFHFNDINGNFLKTQRRLYFFFPNKEVIVNLPSNINAISMLEKNLDKIDWSNLSSNINAIPILEKNLDKVHWSNLSSNINAIPILEKNLDKIDWSKLSSNINAISILEKNPDKVNWSNLSKNINMNIISIPEKDKVNKCFIQCNTSFILGVNLGFIIYGSIPSFVHFIILFKSKIGFI